MLNKHLFTKKEQQKTTRAGFGDGLVEAATKNKKVVGLCADLTKSVHMDEFKEKFPKRFVQVGVAEQNLIGLAAGMAAYGKIPFAASFAMFSAGRGWEQIRNSVAYPNNNVKIIGSHGGLSNGADGATHQALEDIAIMRPIPNMTILSPCDALQAHTAILAAAKHKGPVYIRLARSNTPIITTPKTPFKIGKAQILKNGTDATIIATGPLVYEALLAAEILAGNKKAFNTLISRYPDITENFTNNDKSFAPESIKKMITDIGSLNIEVINIHTIKPLDEKTIIQSAKKTGQIITLEEHQITGGLFSAISETLSKHHPTRITPLGMNNSFGESGRPMELLEKHNMTTPTILQTIQQQK